MKLKLSLTVLALSVGADISSSLAGPNDTSWNPPARYDHAYTTGKLNVYSFPQAQVQRRCRLLFADGSGDVGKFYGCMILTKTTCTIIMIDKNFEGVSPRAVLRHELGHCNGWPSNHPEE